MSPHRWVLSIPRQNFLWFPLGTVYLAYRIDLFDTSHVIVRLKIALILFDLHILRKFKFVFPQQIVLQLSRRAIKVKDF